MVTHNVQFLCNLDRADIFCVVAILTKLGMFLFLRGGDLWKLGTQSWWVTKNVKNEIGDFHKANLALVFSRGCDLNDHCDFQRVLHILLG